VRVDRVFALLIESGFIYCCIWVCPTYSCRRTHCAVADFIFDLDFRRVASTRVYYHSLYLSEYCTCVSSKFSLALNPDLTQSLYPTLIIVLVGMQMSPVEHYSTHSTRMQFAPGPALGPLKDTSTPRHVFTIHHEYVSDPETQIPAMIVMKTSGEEQSLSP
jgi:hypothetical protein